MATLTDSASITCLTEVSLYTLFLMIILGFYDPDGYLFDKNRRDEFGGHYDEQWRYHPGEANKHEFQDMYNEDYDDDDLIR